LPELVRDERLTKIRKRFASRNLSKIRTLTLQLATRVTERRFGAGRPTLSYFHAPHPFCLARAIGLVHKP
jgi:hypothetical protein